MSRFEPVNLPEELAPKGAVSATFGQMFNQCPRSAFLYQLYRRTPMSAPFLEKGSALHRILELATLAGIEQGELLADMEQVTGVRDFTPSPDDLRTQGGETIVPPEVVKAIADEVLEDPTGEYRCPVEYHDITRESAYRWASETVIRPKDIIAVETLFELDLGPLKLRCKIDRAEVFDGGARVEVVDYKSTRAMPSKEDVGRKRSDGTIAAKDFQLISYAAAIVFGRPIVEETNLLTGERTETVQPFSLAERAQRVDLAYVFPAVVGKDGLMGSRGVSLSRLELEVYLGSLRGFAAQVAHSIDTGDWPASYSEDWCHRCPSVMECPIPTTLRDLAGEINTVEDAREAAEKLGVERIQHQALRKELVAFVKAQPAGFELVYGGKQTGGKMLLTVGYQKAEEVKDRGKMIAAARRTAEYGAPFVDEEHIKTKESTPIVDRKLTAAELEERARREKGNDADDGDASGGGPGDGRGADAGAAGAADA